MTAQIAPNAGAPSAILAAADVDKGARGFGKCKACHKLEDGANSTGPTLFNIVDRDIASVAGFGYSGVLADMAGNWTPQALSDFLENPKAFATSRMALRGWYVITVAARAARSRPYFR